MLEISDRRIGQRMTFPPLPPHPSATEMVKDALPLLRPPSRISVTAAAERDIRVPVQGNWQSYDREITPYMVEPQDMTTSRRYQVVAFTGPSQTGKTQMLQNTAMHRVTCNQMPVLIVHMDRPARDKWVEGKLDPMILNSPVLRDAMQKGRDDSTFSRKRFRGMRVEIGYPTPAMLSSATYGFVALTDYDHMKQVLGPKDAPEGSPLGMARQRVKTYMSRGCVLVESSCAFPWADPSWHPVPDAPHLLPPTTGGIVLIYNQGTRARLYWECRDCGGEFEPTFDKLVYDESLPPGDAGETAEMQCPHCGVLIAHRHKMEMNRAILRDKGGWRHETASGEIAAIGDAAIRATDIASYALNGAAATFSHWRDIVAGYESARAKAAQLGDTTDLAQVFYTEIGLPFRAAAFGDDSEMGLQFLRDHAQDTPKGVAPDWTRFITVSCDVQATRFPVQIMAWGEGGRAQIVDRFDLITPPADAPGATEGEDSRSLDPARYFEDWSVLDGLAERVIPVEGQGYGLTPMALVVDFQGAPGVSDNAEKFWRARRAAGQGSLWFVSRGHGGLKQARRVWHEKPERGSKGRKARTIKILNFATDRLKSTIWSAMGKAELDATGALYMASWMSDAEIEEALAEQLDEKSGWEKRPGKVRNETFDLAVMGRALAEHKGLNTVKWDAPPPHMTGGPQNSYAVPIAGTESGETETPATVPQQPRRRVPRSLF